MPGLLVPKAGNGRVVKGQEDYGSSTISGSMGQLQGENALQGVLRVSQDLVGTVVAGSANSPRIPCSARAEPLL